MKTLHSHVSTFIFTFFLFYPFLCVAIDTITPTQPLTINQTLVSNGEVFELGFFNTSNNLYIGIWYKQIQPITYVWVANRDTPITSSSGNLTIVDNGNMVLVDQAGTIVWSSNQSTPVVKTVAQLLDNGNFVLRPENDENPENYIWQSFDYPTDTLLPEMKLGWDRKSGINRFLKSWKTNENPATGDYSFKLNISGFPEILATNNENITWRSGPWNGRTFSGTPEMNGVSILRFEFQENSEEIVYSFEIPNSSVYSRVVIISSGISERLVWAETTKTWNVFWAFPGDLCDHFGECGPFGVCDATTAPVCNCMTGFRPKNKQAWDLRDGSDGCVRSSELDCGSDEFLLLKHMKLPESSKAIVNQTMNLSECGEICKRSCSCVAYANMNITEGGSGCVIWEVDLIDMRQYADFEGGGQDLYVRVTASDLDKTPMIKRSKNGSSSDNKVVKPVAISIGVFALVTVLLILFYLRKKKIRLSKKAEAETKGPRERAEDFLLNDGSVVPNKREMDELELPLFDFSTLVTATNNFSNENKLGQGGFGCVYKGKLMEGEVVAIKRLSRISDQGIEELKNEVRLIAKLQHRNLVRVLGCCIEAEEKLLIYEFMENKSLDMFIFEKEKSMTLNWKSRLEIMCGIARGLLYLHQDSRFKIIHRDLKASNILLDKDMNPKISDFGMARIFGSDQTDAKTKKVVGTYGYMSPEYAMDGHFSTKSDVFSFGVLVLEIVSGKRNTGSSYSSSQHNLLGETWTLWKEGKALELVDKSMGAKFSENEVLRCIQIGLLCVQEHPEDRPNMSKVLFLLCSETVQISPPKYSGFFIRRRNTETESSSQQDDFMTINEITVSILHGR
ncbi:unnamed protein product [Lactuca saligna]|uniref:Receptor-like serine/threonine-protein kinase n=1 Tax=Lactuca saligna TaxID=75948 RepID=A0AA35ZJ88_LACSI|nr:unnamed protein product [Lactuca saligna]